MRAAMCARSGCKSTRHRFDPDLTGPRVPEALYLVFHPSSRCQDVPQPTREISFYRPKRRFFAEWRSCMNLNAETCFSINGYCWAGEERQGLPTRKATRSSRYDRNCHFLDRDLIRLGTAAFFHQRQHQREEPDSCGRMRFGSSGTIIQLPYAHADLEARLHTLLRIRTASTNILMERSMNRESRPVEHHCWYRQSADSANENDSGWTLQCASEP